MANWIGIPGPVRTPHASTTPAIESRRWSGQRPKRKATTWIFCTCRTSLSSFMPEFNIAITMSNKQITGHVMASARKQTKLKFKGEMRPRKQTEKHGNEARAEFSWSCLSSVFFPCNSVAAFRLSAFGIANLSSVVGIFYTSVKGSRSRRLVQICTEGNFACSRSASASMANRSVA